YIVSFGNFIDETSVLSDLILPDHSFLESWVHSAPESGAKVAVSTVAGPVMRPLHETRSTPDVLLDVAKRLGKPIDLKWKSFEEMVQEPAASPKVETAKAQTLAAVKYSEPRFDGDANQFGFHFLPYPSIAFLD